MTDQLYIWIVRWHDFQHYAPERDRAPAWIKTYTKQHDDDDYRRLTGPQRAILHDLRIAFAKSNGRLTSEQRALTQRIGLRVTSAQLETLRHAGFIEIVSRETLDRLLEKLYTSRARDRAHHQEVEVEREEDVEEEPTQSVSETRPAPKPELPLRAADDIPWDEPAGNGAGAGSGDLERIDPQALLEQIGGA